MVARIPNLQILHQKGRDEDARNVIQNLGKQLALARKEACTMAWLGDEAKRREIMKVCPMACGVIRKAVESPPVPLLSPLRQIY